MKRLILAALLVFLLAASAGAGGLDSWRYAVQQQWWNKTINDTIAAGDFNRYYLSADSTGATTTYVEFATFEADTIGYFKFWNGNSAEYNADTTSWYFDANEPVEINAKGGLDSIYVYNPAGSAMRVRIQGKRR